MPKKRPAPKKRPPLGRGLAALLPTPSATGPAVTPIPVAKIDPNPVQPRAEFDGASLRKLADSILRDGVLQPILVRDSGERYTLIVGERRVRACKLAGMPTVPALVRDIAEDKLLEVALVENLQRENLNPIEVAAALQRMTSELGLIHDQLAERTGMSRASVTNHLRLLRLPDSVKRLVRGGQLKMGHARALLTLGRPADQRALARRAADEDLSVRDVERLARKMTRPPKKKRPAPAIDPNVAAAIEKLERVLQAPVKLKQTGNRGKLEISFNSQEQLAAIYDRIVGEPV